MVAQVGISATGGTQRDTRTNRQCSTRVVAPNVIVGSRKYYAAGSGPVLRSRVLKLGVGTAECDGVATAEVKPPGYLQRTRSDVDTRRQNHVGERASAGIEYRPIAAANSAAIECQRGAAAHCDRAARGSEHNIELAAAHGTQPRIDVDIVVRHQSQRDVGGAAGADGTGNRDVTNACPGTSGDGDAGACVQCGLDGRGQNKRVICRRHNG